MTVIELAGSRLDDWWQDLMARPGARRAWQWGGPAIVLLVATLTRLVGLGHPHELVFDETYYVKDAYTLSHLGYEGSWPADANLSFNAGHPEIYLEAPVVRRAPADRQVDHRARPRRCSGPATRSAGGSRSRSAASCWCSSRC